MREPPDDLLTRGARIRALFERVLDADPAGRDALLEEARAADPSLCEEVRELLEVHQELGNRLEQLDAEAAADLLEGEEPDFPEGGSVGRFRILRRVGQGGMGLVYQAYDPELQRHVALKVLTSDGPRDRSSPDRLLQEARATSQLEHPRIATVFDVGRTEDGRLFMAMAYYPGETLARRIREGPVPSRQAAVIARQVAEALEAAHGAGVVHRDIKPANVMLLPDGNIRVLDFGVARVLDAVQTRTGGTMGTPAYMSPEQITGSPVDGRSDIWSLGVVLYEMLTGHLPFRAETSLALAVQIQEASPREPDESVLNRIPSELWTIVERCLEKDPEDRYSNATALLEDLTAVTRPQGTGGRSRRMWQALTGVAAAGLLAAVGLPMLMGGEDIHPSASVLAVFPPSPAAEDSMLTRIGRELAVTVSMNLNGVGGIRVLDPVTVLSRPDLTDTDRPLEDRIQDAMELGATGVVSGTILRLGDGVQVELALQDGTGPDPVTRASASLPAGELVELTDSLSWKLLKGIWRVRDPPTPSITGITTRSFESLRAFLEGEQLVADGRFREAPEAFSRAIQADSTFWLAYWRLWWTADWYGQDVNPLVPERVMEHLGALPARDSILAEGRALPHLSDRVAAYKRAVEAFPQDWLAWFMYQDILVHDGGYMGVGLAESRDALERVVRLNPELVRGWEHLFWIALGQRDMVRIREVVQRLDELAYDSISALESGFDLLQYFRVQERTLLNGGLLTPEDLTMVLGLMAGVHGTAPPRQVMTNLVSDGFAEATVQVFDSLRNLDLPLPSRSAAWFALSLGNAARGRWNAALDAAEEQERVLPSLEGALHGFRLASVGAALGVVDPEDALVWETRMNAYPLRGGNGIHAEVTWLRGLGRAATGQVEELQMASEELQELDGEQPAFLAGSLQAIRLALEGDTAQAGDAAVTLLENSTETYLFRRLADHPFADGLLRLLAAGWLRAGGRTTAASRLLTWYEAVLPDGAEWMVPRANRILEPLAHLERARVETELDRPASALWHYARVWESLEEAEPPLRSLAEEAHQALEGRASRHPPPGG